MKDVPMTVLLQRINEGDQEADNALFKATYDELAILAHRYLQREKPGRTLDTKAVVHEAYLKLFGNTPVDWHDRTHFFVLAARAMRRLLVDHARAANADKRGGRHDPLALSLVKGHPDRISGLDGDEAQVLMSLHHALEKLENQDPVLSRIIDLRFYQGMTVPETAGILGLSARSVNREWKAAKAFLYNKLAEIYEASREEESTTDSEET